MKTMFNLQKILILVFTVININLNLQAQDVVPILESGNKYLQENEYNLAIDQFDMVLDIDDTNPDALIGKAKAYLGLKKHNKAINELLKAINTNDNVPEAFLELGKIHYRFGNYPAAQKAFEAGIEESEEAGKLHNGALHNGALHYYLGATLYHEEDYNKSKTNLEQALAYGDSTAYNFYYLSDLALQEDSLDWAMKYIDEAIKRNPNIPRFHLGKGNVSYAQGDYLWASLHYSTALRLNPDYLQARMARAKAYLADEKYALALADLRKIVEVEPDIAQVWADKGLCEYSLGKYEDAIHSYTEALKLENDYSWVNKRAVAYQSNGDFDKAINDLKYLTEIYPEDSKLHFRLANLYQLNSNYEKALSEYKKCIDLDRNDVLAWNNKAVVLYYLGAKEHACHIWNEIVNKSFDEDFRKMARENILNYCKKE